MIARPLGVHWWRYDRVAASARVKVCVRRCYSQIGQGYYEETIPENILTTRIDAWIAEQLPNASRARVKDSILKGFATVNGKTVTKPSFPVEGGDHVVCTLVGAGPLEAKPEDIKLNIVHEDEHIIVVNKSADMVVHPAPGHSSGTLVNAILHHCGLPAVQVPPRMMGRDVSSDIDLEESGDDEGGEFYESDEDDEEEADHEEKENKEKQAKQANANTKNLMIFGGLQPVIRPGIVHRLDKGTSGLLVVAKNEQAQVSLCEQFRARKARRTYVSLTCGTPSKLSDRIEAAIVRDPKDRKRMTTADSISNPRKARFAASRYKVLDVVAEGGSALVEWKLETGRTHQIRVHARYIGYPILGDELYGGTSAYALSRMVSSLHPHNRDARQRIQDLVSGIQRPCLHAYSLGFKHPTTNERVRFTCSPPADFENIWRSLREFNSDGA